MLDFTLRGHLPVGVEGSNRSQIAQRAEWRVLPGRLITADITQPFELQNNGQLMTFDVISAWVVLEHIADDDLPLAFANIERHLDPGGLLIGSITCIPDGDIATGANCHRTVQPRRWWEERFQSLGFFTLNGHAFQYNDFCLGSNSV